MNLQSNTCRAVVSAAASLWICSVLGGDVKDLCAQEVGLAWDWKPGNETWQPRPGDACQPVTFLPGQQTKSGMSHNGFTFDCLEIEGQTWDEQWQSLADDSLIHLAAAPLDNNNELKVSVCTDPDAQHLMKYIVRCALGYETSGVPETLTFDCDDGSAEPPPSFILEGRVGVAKGWRDETLDEADARGREKVTACLMAHANPAGEEVAIAPRSSYVDPVMQAESLEESDLPEGAFAGNLFPVEDGTAVSLYAFYHPDWVENDSGRICTLPGDVSLAASESGANQCGFIVRPAALQCASDPMLSTSSHSVYGECLTDVPWLGAIDDHPMTIFVSDP